MMASKLLAILLFGLVLGTLLELSAGNPIEDLADKVTGKEEKKKDDDNLAQAVAKKVADKVIDEVEDTVKEGVDNKLANPVIGMATKGIRKKINKEIDKSLDYRRKKRSATPSLDDGLEPYFQSLSQGEQTRED